MDRDAVDLARLGKRPVLKVRPSLLLHHERLMLTMSVAQVWAHVITGLQLHHPHHLGRRFDVS